MRLSACSLRSLLLVAICILVFVYVGCEGEKGAQGPAGLDGTTQCVECHSDDTDIVARVGQWENSIHATGGNFERNDSECAGCHTSEGFVARMATGSAGSPDNPSSIGCFTCHTPHTSYDFSLRSDDPVVLVRGETFDMGAANLCANCHQAWIGDPPVTDTTRIESAYWGPHHGTQGSMLAGTDGYEFAGYSYSNSPHTNGIDDGCIECHMADPYGVQAGGHTMNLEYEYHGHGVGLVTGCNVEDCHDGAVEDFNHDDAQDDTKALLDELRTALMAASLLDSTDHAVPDKVNTRTAVEAGALYNFLFVLEDRSDGIHNTDYAEDLLQSSLDELAK